VPDVIIPVYGLSEQYKDGVLFDKTYSIANYLIKHAIWPVLVPSRQILAIVHVFDENPNYVPESVPEIGDIALKFIVSKYKTSDRLIITKLQPSLHSKLKAWNYGNASIIDIENIILGNNNKKAVWLENGVNCDELFNSIKLMCTLNSI
jgi:hypothetical protein